MSASTEERVANAHNRAATYNVSKDSRRRVKWLALQGDEPSDTHAKGFHNLQLNHNLGKPGDAATLGIQNVKLKESDELVVQQTRSILPSLTSRTAQLHLAHPDRRDHEQSCVGLPEISQVDDNPVMTSKDTQSSSRSASILRKEDTFIVTDKEPSSGLISPTDDLRRRKAMALAKANARHAVKLFQNRRFYPRSTESHKVAVTQSRIHDNQSHFRPYIKNISSEVRNNKGEKIYFHWTESVFSGGTSASRVPQGVRKLYEYKRKRLKQKYSNFLNSKSAPHNKSGLDNLSSELSGKPKRGKTADEVVYQLRKGSVSGSKRRAKARVAFVMSESEARNSGTRKVTCLRMNVGGNEKNKNQSMNVSEDAVLKPNDGWLADESKWSQNIDTIIVADTYETAYSTNMESFGKYAQTPVLRESDNKTTKIQSITPWPPSTTNSLKETSNVPCISNTKLNSVQGFQIPHSQRQDRSAKTSQTGKNNSVNSKYNSTTSVVNVANILNFNSCDVVANTSPTQLPKNARFDSKCGDTISNHGAGIPSPQSINDSYSNRLAKCSRDNDLSSSYRKGQLLCRNSSTKAVDHVSDARHPAIDNVQVVDQDTEEENINPSSLEPNSPRGDASLTKSLLTSRSRGSIQQNIPGNCASSTHCQVEHIDRSILADASVVDSHNQKINLTDLEENHCNHVTQDNSHTCSKVRKSHSKNSRTNVTKKGKEFPADFKDKYTNYSSETEIAKLRSDKGVDKGNDRGSLKTRSRTRDGVRINAQNSNQTRDDVQVSNTRIDQAFVNKSVEGVTSGRTCDPEIQCELISREPDTQSRVNSLKPGNGVATGHGVGRSQRDASVATATSKVNKEVTRTADRRKQVDGTNSSLPRLMESGNNLSSLENEKCHHEQASNDFSQRPGVKENGHFAYKKRSSSQPSPLDNSSNIFVNKHCSHSEVPDKQVCSVRHKCRSIPNGPATNMLKLDLVEVNRDEEVQTPVLSINRCTKGTDLPQGEPHLLNFEQGNRNMSTNRTLPGQSKTLKILPKKKEIKLDLCPEIKKSSNGVSSGDGITKELNLAPSVNCACTLQKRSANNDSREDTSITGRRSTHDKEIIYTTSTTDGFSLHEDPSSRDMVGNCAQFTNRDSIGAKENIENYNSSLPNGDILSVTCGDNCIHIGSRTVPNQGHRGLEDCRIINKDVKHFTPELQQKLHCSGKKTYPSGQTKGREQDRKRREALSLPTQNMEFTDIPTKKGTQNNESAQPQKSYKHEGANVAKHERIASKQKDIINVNGIDFTNHTSNELLRSSSRPKTAGVSAFSKPKCEDMWSVRTEGDEDDDDDDDDQIQFIEGEQDFYKVFGYNEETVAILNATKVYPVSGSVDPSWGFGPSDCDVAATNDIYADNRSTSYLLNRGVVNGADRNDGASYDTAVVSDTRINENKSSKKCEDSWKRKDQKKQIKLANNLPSHAPKPANKNASSHQHEAQKDVLSCCLNVYGHVRNSTHHTTASLVAGEDPPLTKHKGVEDNYDQNSRNPDLSSNTEKNGLTNVPTHNQTRKGLASKFPVGHFDNLHSTETLTRLGDTRQGQDTKVRRRIHSETDILTTNMDDAQPTSGYGGSFSNQTGQVIPLRDGTLLTSKDSKSHVALRNHIATERHINQTRYHRTVTNNLQHQKTNFLQTSPAAETQNSRPNDKVENRIHKNKDSIRGAQLKGSETPIQQNGTPFNPYMQAADRIMSRFAEHSINNHVDANNITTNQLQEATRDKNTVSSPLRRMSHPVDNRLTPKGRSYFVPRPRKLEPIAQVTDVKQSHQ